MKEITEKTVKILTVANEDGSKEVTIFERTEKHTEE